MKIGRKYRIISLALVSLTAMLAYMPAASAKDTLTIGRAQFPTSLNPYLGSATVNQHTIGFASRPITAFMPDGKPACLLCAALPTLENGLARYETLPDGSQGLAVTIKLRPDLKWGDGVPVTSKDIYFTWSIGKDPASGLTNLNPWERASSVEVVDDRTVILHLTKPFVTYQMWDHLLPEHLEGPIKSAATTPLDYINKSLYNVSPTTAGLWNGPYVVTGYASGDRVTLSPNKYWEGKKTRFRQIVVRTIENTSALTANLLSGDIDMSPSGGITSDQAVALERDHPEEFQFFWRPGMQLERINVQTDNKALADVDVRKALLLAIDRKTLVDRLFSGRATVADTWINELEPNYTTEGVPIYPFNPGKARELLDAAGWKAGPDGIRRNPSGEKLIFEFTTTSGNAARSLSQQVLQSQWKAVGIHVNLKNEPGRTFFGETMRKRQFKGLAEYGRWAFIGVPPTTYFHSSQLPTAENNYSGTNWTGFKIPEFDELLTAAETELDTRKQKEIWAKMQRIYAEQLIEIPLYFRQDPDIVPVWLKNYETTGKESFQSYLAENWSE
ncbi:peptide ABC transporter substrate-binding protein [Sinorhizobium meliloti]|uniref:peptide ABC transporter substrate-binding protein n=1 Tax=Rhizobium meliloti TaxID=382 RepID=UPI001296D9A2|nr:peptide ABC transporter substrate-binding protein [Sinorhizobium meliloti]MQU72449.1 peptide ABC transporter substrate-binding protein [Sinorhizobium meliloti]